VKRQTKRIKYEAAKGALTINDPVGKYGMDLLDRTIQFSLRIIKLYREIEKDRVGQIIGKQLLKSGTSVGANIHEGQGGQTRPDFIAKYSIAYKEALETAYWLRIVEDAKIIPSTRLFDLKDETTQLIKILSTILIRTKQNMVK
jgi:four helix bundle protein